MTLRHWILFTVLAACLSVGLLAGAEVEHYNALTAAPAEIVTDATGADSTDTSTTITDRRLPVKSNPTVAVGVDFSGSATDTVVVSCILWHEVGGVYTVLPGVQTATATAGAYLDAAGGDNVANSILFFDTAGATHYEIRHAAPSAGNVDITVWTYGLQSE